MSHADQAKAITAHAQQIAEAILLDTSKAADHGITIPPVATAHGRISGKPLFEAVAEKLIPDCFDWQVREAIGERTVLIITVHDSGRCDEPE